MKCRVFRTCTPDVAVAPVDNIMTQSRWMILLHIILEMELCAFLFSLQDFFFVKIVAKS